MTSASELFHSRRYRSGLRQTTVTITSPSEDPDYQHRSTLRRNTRRDLDGCVRRIHTRRLIHLENQHVDGEEGGSNPTFGIGGGVNVDGVRSLRRHSRSTGGAGSERLPGSVLLARERLVERLRGVSVSRNRQSSGSSSTTDQNSLSTHNVSEIRNNTMAETVSESRQEVRRNNPLGLTRDEVKCLQLEVCSIESCREKDEISMGCSICLEGFQDGDKIVRLVCTHIFHSCCLFPWVRVSGVCPNCRELIVVNAYVKK